MRRPYPTEMDMRSSLLAKLTDPGSGQSVPAQALPGYADMNRCPPPAALGDWINTFSFVYFAGVHDIFDCCFLQCDALLAWWYMLSWCVLSHIGNCMKTAKLKFTQTTPQARILFSDARDLSKI